MPRRALDGGRAECVLPLLATAGSCVDGVWPLLGGTLLVWAAAAGGAGAAGAAARADGDGARIGIVLRLQPERVAASGARQGGACAVRLTGSSR